MYNLGPVQNPAFCQNRPITNYIFFGRHISTSGFCGSMPILHLLESLWGAKSRMRRTETPKPIWIKFCTVVDIPDLVNYANFGDHRLRGFWVAGGQISPSPIDFHRRPYNTLALPCERVISSGISRPCC